MTGDDLARKAVRGGGATLILQGVKVLVMLLSLIVLARIIDPHEYGIFAMVIAVVGVAEIFRDFGLSMAAIQAKHLSREQQNNLFWINAGIGAALTALVFGLSWPLSAFYGEPVIAALTQTLSVTFLINGLSTQFKVVVNRRLEFVKLSTIDVLPYALGFGAALVAALNGAGVWSLALQQIAIAIFTLGLAIFFSRWFPGRASRVPMDGLVSFGWRIAVTQIIGYFSRNVDSIAIGRVWGSGQLGFYDRGFQIVMMPINQLNAPLSKVAVPLLASVRDDEAQYARALRKAQLLAAYGTASLFGVLAASGDILVVLVLGERWAPAGIVVQFLAIGAAFRALAQVCYWIYVSKGLASEQMKYFLVAQPLLALVIVAGVPWGIVGVAISTAIGQTAFWVVSLWWACRKANVPVRTLYAGVTRAVGCVVAPASALMWLVSHLILPGVGPWLALTAGIIVAAITAGIAIFAIPPVRQDVRILSGLLTQALRRKGKKTDDS